jgi:hypothetical protein
VVNDTNGTSTAGNAQITGDTAVVTPTTGDGFTAAPGDVITVLVTPTTNPSKGKQTLTLSTSTDPKPVTVSYSITG